MVKKFSDFIKPKTKKWPHTKDPHDVYDDHVDQIMHHLNQIKELTSKESLLHKAGDKIGQDTYKYHAIHGHVKHIIKKHNDDTLEAHDPEKHA